MNDCPLSFKLTWIKAEDTRSGQGKWMIAIKCSQCKEMLVDYIELREEAS